MNVVLLEGNLGRDPELVKTERFGGIVTFDLAVATNDGLPAAVPAPDGKTFWVPVSVHATELLYLAAILQKGDRVRITGHLNPVGGKGKIEVAVGPGGRLDRIQR